MELALGIHTVEHAIALQEQLMSFRILMIQVEVALSQLVFRSGAALLLGRVCFRLQVILSDVEREMTG